MTPNHYSCLLGTLCGPGWNHKLGFWEGKNQRMLHLGFHSCQRLSLPLNVGSVSSQSIYNDINYLKFPQNSVELNTHSATSSQTYTSRNNLLFTLLPYPILYSKESFHKAASISNKFVILLICVGWWYVPYKLPLLCLKHKKPEMSSKNLNKVLQVILE